MQHRRATDKLSSWQSIITIITTACLIIGGGSVWAWNVFARPAIKEQIDCELKPVKEAIEYQNYLMMSTMSDEQIERAEKMYISAKRGRVDKTK